jgi:peptidoglycan/LPS O-acetylase OafA/YrhL
MRLGGIDLLRGIAVSAVIIYHFFELLGLSSYALYPYITSIGQIGVPLFFIISGYLIYRSIDYSITHNGIKSGLKHYILHRLFRILPAYYFNFLIVIGLASTIIGAEYFYSSHFLNQIFSHLTFSSYFIYQNSGLGVNGAYWTLSIEMLWYIVAPLLFIFIKKDRYYLILIICAFFYLWSIDLGLMDILLHLDKTASNYLTELYYYSFQLPAQIIYFISGIFIYKHLTYKDFISNNMFKLFIFTLLIWGFINISHQHFFLTSFVMKNAITLIVSTLIFILFYKSHVPYLSLFDWIGKISYSLYLWHMPILFIMKQSDILSHASLLNTTLLFITSLLAVSSMSYYFIEEGGFRLRKRLEHA